MSFHFSHSTVYIWTSQPLTLTHTERESETVMARKKRARSSSEKNESDNGETSGYEQFRDQRIKENMERMQKLGILDLSHKLKSNTAPSKRNPTPRNPSDKKTQNPLPLSASPRRSSRFFFFSSFFFLLAWESMFGWWVNEKMNGKWKKVFICFIYCFLVGFLKDWVKVEIK